MNSKERGSDMELMENVEQILAALRHEVGNSTNSLKITLDVLRENYDLFDDEKKKHYLERESEILARQERLVDAMKSYSKFNANELKEITLLRFWEYFLNTAYDRLKGSNIELIHHLEIGPGLIEADHVALDRVLKNILDNSVEALEEVDKPKIELKATKTDNGTTMIIIKDNGPGIKKDDVTRVFIPLFTTKPQKAGMGLAIARKLLLQMGGWVEINSLYGSGTEAKVWLKNGNNQES